MSVRVKSMNSNPLYHTTPRIEDVSNKSYKLNSDRKNFDKHHVHLIYGTYGCGKTSLIRDTITQRIKNNENTLLITDAHSNRIYYKDVKSDVLKIVDERCLKITEENNTPELFAKYIIQYYISLVGRLNVDTIIVDGYQFLLVNKDYSEDEFFRELSKKCKVSKINLIYTKGYSSKENVYSSLPYIFERFSDMITIMKL